MRQYFAANFLRVRFDPLRRLALEVIARAVKDARAGEIDAILWLGSEDADPFYCLAEIHPGAVLRMLSKSDKPIDNGHIADLNKYAGLGQLVCM
jgi:hypothetical protein